MHTDPVDRRERAKWAGAATETPRATSISPDPQWRGSRVRRRRRRRRASVYASTVSTSPQPLGGGGGGGGGSDGTVVDRSRRGTIVRTGRRETRVEMETGIIGGRCWRGPCCRFLGGWRSVRNPSLRARAGTGTKRCLELAGPAALASGAAGAGCGFLVGVDAVFPGSCLW
jgi:hypothetical protein